MPLRKEGFDFMCLNFEKNIIGEQDRKSFNPELDGEYIQTPEYDEENIEQQVEAHGHVNVDLTSTTTFRKLQYSIRIGITMYYFSFII